MTDVEGGALHRINTGIEGGLMPGQHGLDPQRLLQPQDAHDEGHAHLPYMPMSREEFCGIDFATASPKDRINYLMMKVRMVRDRNETDEARRYFDGIQAAYEQSFEEVTPDVLADSTRMNLIRCVDPYTDKQLDALNYPPEALQKLPGGLAWFDLTGTMYDWITPRIFNEEIAAGMHRNCGGLAIIGALTGERQVTLRDSAESKAKAAIDAVATAVRNEYLRRRRSRLDLDAADVLPNFGGPRLVFAWGESGTAERFVTPKTPLIANIGESFTSHELVENMDKWIQQKVSARDAAQAAE